MGARTRSEPRGLDAGGVATRASDRAAPSGSRHPHQAAVIGVVVVLLVTGGLSYAAWKANDRNERHLLRQQVAQAGSLLTVAVTNIQSPLVDAAQATVISPVPSAGFKRIMTANVGKRGPFLSATLWPPGALQPQIVLGAAPALASRPASAISRFFERTAKSSQFSVIQLSSSTGRRLGYAFNEPSGAGGVVYAEVALPKNRQARPQPNSAYRNVEYAFYLGRSERAADLLAASPGYAAQTGRRASATVPFGDTYLRIVFAPRGNLGGWLIANLYWIVGVAGVLLALAVGLVAERLVRRGEAAFALARQNRELYAQQRDVAVALQQSLLPEVPALAPGLEAAARYEPAAAHAQVGGDWYDVVPRPDGAVLVIVGDVAGHGLTAASSMAALRFAARAYAAEGYDPAEIANRLGSLMDTGRDGVFATMLCAELDPATQSLVLANAGHPRPIVIDEAGASLLETALDPPLGLPVPGGYRATAVSLAATGTVLAFTDGLFERRGEPVDDGLERIRRAAMGHAGSLDDLLDQILRLSVGSDHPDDVVVVATRWHAVARERV